MEPLNEEFDAAESAPRPKPHVFSSAWFANWTRKGRVARGAELGRILGLGFLGIGLVFGVLHGGVMRRPSRGFDLDGALRGVGLGLSAGGLAALYGFLQGVIGVRTPQPHAGGILSAILVVGTGIGVYFGLDVAPAVAAAFVVGLVSVRLVGCHFPMRGHLIR